MYCPKCGNKLSENDVFCSKCGAKIVLDNQNKKVGQQRDFNDNSNQSFLNKIMRHSITKFIFYFIIWGIVMAIVTEVTYAIPHHLSIFDYIIEPAGLIADAAGTMGSVVVDFLFFLPLILSLPKWKLMKSSHPMEVFFLLMLIEGISLRLLGFHAKMEWHSQVMTPVTLFVLVFGGLMLLIGNLRSKK